MMGPRRRALVAEVAAIATPLAVLVAAPLVLGPEPSGASARPVAANLLPPVQTSAKPLTAPQQRAAEWIAGAMVASDLRSPMDHPTLVALTPTSVVPETAPSSAIRLAGVLGSGQNALAAIGGKIYRVGEEVSPGVRVAAIDARAGTVDLKYPDGSVVRLTREKK